jgi:hypothetical protein
LFNFLQIYMRKFYLLVFVLTAYSLSAQSLIPSESTSSYQGLMSKGRNNRTFGIGINWTFPATGFSAKYAFQDNLKIQGSFSIRSYGSDIYKYTWSMYGASLEYCFKESSFGNGEIIPFLYAGGGRGVLNYGEAFGLQDDNFGWWAYNVGAGLEFFPSFLDGNLGITSKIGFGSIGAGSGVGGVSVNGVFMYGAGFHYYIN